MSNIPKNILPFIQNLELHASRLINQNEYSAARSYYFNVLNILNEKQEEFNKRIHLGAPLHMIGVTFVLEEKADQGFDFFLKAYIADIINQQYGNEREAEGSPAYNILIGFFALSIELINRLYEKALEIRDRNIPFQPEIFLSDLLREMDVDRNNLTRFYNLPDSARLIINGPIEQIPVSQEARLILNKAASDFGSNILEIAFSIAKRENRTEITESDVDQALLELQKRSQKNDF